MPSVHVKGDVAEMKRVAERLEADNPRWIIVFGDYSRQFVAFPRFPVPRGTVVAAQYPDALPPRMRAVESAALPDPATSAAPEGHAIAMSKPTKGHSDDGAGR